MEDREVRLLTKESQWLEGTGRGQKYQLEITGNKQDRGKRNLKGEDRYERREYFHTDTDRDADLKKKNSQLET